MRSILLIASLVTTAVRVDSIVMTSSWPHPPTALEGVVPATAAMTSFTVAELISGQSFGEISVLTRPPLTAAAAFAAAMTPINYINPNTNFNPNLNLLESTTSSQNDNENTSNRFELLVEDSMKSSEELMVETFHLNISSHHPDESEAIPCLITGEPISAVTAICCTAVEVYCLDSDMLVMMGLQEDYKVCNALLQDLKYHSPPEEEIVSFLKEKAKWEMVKASIVQSIRAQVKQR